MNIRDRTREEDFFAARVLKEAALGLEQNRDAERFFLLYVQHTDIAAQVLQFAGLPVPQDLDGGPFYEAALAGGPPRRDHVTTAWDTAVTVLRDRWWFNGKINGKGVFLHGLEAAEPFGRNVADEHRQAAEELYALAVADAGGGIPRLADGAGRGRRQRPRLLGLGGAKIITCNRAGRRGRRERRDEGEKVRPGGPAARRIAPPIEADCT